LGVAWNRLLSGDGARCYFILRTKRDRICYAHGSKREAKGEERSKTETKTTEHTKKNELHLEAELVPSYFDPRGASRGEVLIYGNTSLTVVEGGERL
jgi:hypothetical protein